jgi:hypothetical protein
MAEEQQTLSIETRLASIEGKLDDLVTSNKKLRTYLLLSIAVPLILLVLPLLAIPFILPFFNNYLSTLTLPEGF